MSRKTWVFIAVISVMVPALMLARAGRSQKPQANNAADKEQTLKIDVDLTLVNATVTDALNRYVSGLEQEHFQIWEDKFEQKICVLAGAEDGHARV